MKIVKSTETPTERALVGFTEAVKEVPKKLGGFFTDARKKNFMIICAVFLVGAAVILNIALFGGKKTVLDAPEDAPTGSVDSENGEETSTEDPESYFALATLDRAQAREEALEVLQSVVESEAADEATKTAALLEIAELAKAMEAEANIESLVLSKGFTQCVAVINDDTCSVVVNGTELQQSQISQINEIVYEQAGIAPQSVRIITK